MKRANLLFVFGGLSFLLVTIFLLWQERELARQALESRRAELEASVNQSWEEYLQKSLPSEPSTEATGLTWDLNQKRVVESIFPEPTLTMNWQEYRDAVDRRQNEVAQDFLQRALKTKGWDRYLALTELGTPADQLQGLFEKSLIDPRARQQGRLLFDAVSELESGQWLPQSLEYRHVFARPQGDTVRLFLPTDPEIQDWLNQFPGSKAYRLRLSTENPLHLEIQSIRSLETWAPWIKVSLYILPILLFLAGLYFRLHQARLDQQEALRRISFLDQLVHELKTPLAALKLHAQLAQRDGYQTETAEQFEGNIRRMEILFDDLTALNHPEIFFEKKRVSAVDLSSLLTELQREFDGQLTIQGKVASDHFFYPPFLRLALRNLIKNGIRYGTRVELQIREEPQLIFTVRDEGPGIPHSEAKDIFNEFFRGAHGRNKSPDGLGLGLNLTQRSLLMMGWSVRLTNPGEAPAIFEVEEG